MKPSMPLQIAVVGSSGALGQLICKEVLRLWGEDVQLFLGDYCPQRSQQLAQRLGRQAHAQVLNAHDMASIQAGIQGKDGVIVALNQQEPRIQHACLLAGVPCVDMTVLPEFVAKVKQLIRHAPTQSSPLLLHAGFFPGMSGLLAKALAHQFDVVDSLNLALLFNQNANHGLSGVVQMARALTLPVAYQCNGDHRMVPGLSKRRPFFFPAPFGKRNARIMSSGEREILAANLGLQTIHYWAAWQTKWMGPALYALHKAGILTILQKYPTFLARFFHHDPQQPEDTAIVAEATGQIAGKQQRETLAIATFSDYGTTAKATACMTKILLQQKRTGLVFPIEMTDLATLLKMMDCHKIKLQAL